MAETVPENSVHKLGKNIRVCQSGMGHKNAAAAARLLIKSGASALLSWGTAAALDKNLPAGMICMPHSITTANMNIIPIENDFRTEIVSLIDKHLTLCYERMAETQGLLSSIEDKSHLQQKTQAVAADMETAAVAQVAAEHKLPFAAIRAISDMADTIVPASISESTRGGGIHLPTLTMQLLKHPADLLALMKIAFGFRKARINLEQAARILILFFND